MLRDVITAALLQKNIFTNYSNIYITKLLAILWSTER